MQAYSSRKSARRIDCLLPPTQKTFTQSIKPMNPTHLLFTNSQPN